jgi:hypothetical protein
MPTGMPASTSIKVPVALRDRLAGRAHRDGTTLAGALERALDRAVSVQRLERRFGAVDDVTLLKVEAIVRRLVALP